MISRKDSGAFAHDGSDRVVSFDAFKIAKHGGFWTVATLTPWATAMVLDPRCPRGAFIEPIPESVKYGESSRLFGTLTAARDWVRDVEKAAAGWWSPMEEVAT